MIGAVNLNLGYARLFSVGTRWLVMVLAIATALVHLRIAVGIVELAFGILFGGNCFRFGARRRSRLEGTGNQVTGAGRKENPADTVEEPLRHL